MAETLFHVAPATCRDDILSEGLLPDPYSLEEQEPGVYVWGELDAARRCVREFEKIRELPHDIWAINPDGADWTADPLCFNAFFSREPVPAARLTLEVEADLDGWDVDY